MNYIRFKIREDRAESLLHSCNNYLSILKAYGQPLTGAYPKFVEELHEQLRKHREGKKRNTDKK